MNIPGLVAVLGAGLLLGPALPAQTRITTAREIREEALRPNHSTVGRPLPLAASWNSGGPSGAGFTPGYLLDQIEAGHHLLISFGYPVPPGSLDPNTVSIYRPALERAARLGLPFTLLSGNFADVLCGNDYLQLPPAENPNVIEISGKVRKQLDPMGPVEKWRQAGVWLASSVVLGKLQEWYPDPPLVIFQSNNEESRLNWTEVEQSKRYLEKYGPDRIAAFQRAVVAQGWRERYRAMLDALRAGLKNPNWRKRVIFVGYDAFGPPHYARWDGWQEYALTTEKYISAGPLLWDGGSPSFYLHNWNASTDYNVWSPQGEAQNWVFMQKEALRLNPHFWFELSTWDGEEEKRQKLSEVGPFTPARYGAMVEFGMWLLRPRSVREFRGWTDTLEKGRNWFEPIVAAVDRVYSDETLRRFWRHGELVPNRAHRHPYQLDEIERYAKEDRWFLLDTTADPPRPYGLDTHLPVFAIALVLGKTPRREWLVYAHAPMGDRENVGLMIPGYRQIPADVPVEGRFYLVREGNPKIERVGR